MPRERARRVGAGQKTRTSLKSYLFYSLLTVLQPPWRGSLLRRHVAALLALLGEQLEVPGVRARGLFGVGLELGVDGLGLGLALALGLGLGLQLRLGWSGSGSESGLLL